MSFLENIINNIENVVLVDELGNEVWSNSELASKLKNRMNGVIQHDDRYYCTKVKEVNHSAQKHYLIQYVDVTNLIVNQNNNTNIKIYKNEQNS